MVAGVMRSIYVAIPDNAAEELREMAKRELRAPRQQAAILILAGLKRARLDQDQRPGDPNEKPARRPARVRPASRMDTFDEEHGAAALDRFTASE